MEQRDLLIRETHHRVKNHLQIIASILQMEALRRGPEVTEFAESLQRRLDVLAAAHEVSYKAAELGVIDAAQHIHRICEPMSSPEHPVVALVDAGVTLTSDQATPVALITNEVICNALKHAFPDRGQGRVDVVLKRDTADVVLTITDNGVGLGDKRQAGTLGLFLVHGLAKQLGGECSLTSGKRRGAVFTLRFPAG
ncbi:MAG: sensor histidine kinase [Actinomycetota bacterium]